MLDLGRDPEGAVRGRRDLELRDRGAALRDPLDLQDWQAMLSASPDQVEAWLNANVTDLASARRVLKILVMAIQLAKRSR